MAIKETEQYVISQSARQALNHSLDTTMTQSIGQNYSRQFEQPDDPDASQLDLSLMSTFSDEDAESLIGPSMSRAATRLKSPKTPALEKKNALEEAIGYYDSGPDTPPADLEEYGGDMTTEPSPNRTSNSSLRYKHGRGLSLDNLPPARPEVPDLPTPWHAGPKTLVLPPDRSQTALQSVFGTGAERKRALSGGADALKKFLPSLPSMAQVGNYFITGSSGISYKSKPSNPPSPSKSPDRLGFGISGSSPRNASPLAHFETGYPTRLSGGRLQKPLRRVTSDDSMLYHTLSRASSLGDDTLFESQRVQVNSRAKAIRDSLQDRSSFRMPNMPTISSLPSLPSLPNFGFNMNFLNNENNATRAKTGNFMSSNIITEGGVPFNQPASFSSPVGERGGSFSPQARSETSKTSESPTKFLDNALEFLTGDIVIMGGYRGSILRSTKTNRQVWAPVKIGLNIRKVDLEVGLEPEDEERMEETIYPSGMLQGIGPVDISRRLFKRLNACENARNGKLRVWDYGYDWRLSPHLLSRKLTTFLENLPSNVEDGAGHRRGALVVAHSLGGLITRHVVNHRPELFSGVIYAGVPQQCVNILGPLRNGDAVLLSSRILTAQVNFTLRTSFVLLPEDGKCFVDINTKERYPVDFFNVDDWIKYRLSPCIKPALPPYSQRGGLGSLINLNISGSKLSIPLAGKKTPASLNGSITPPIPEITNKDSSKQSDQHLSKATRAANVLRDIEGGKDRTIAPQLGNNAPAANRSSSSTTSSISTTVTIPRDKAIAYLRRTLAETKKFKQELLFLPELSEANRYPPMAVIYGKSIPTCCGAKVDGLDSIPCADVYDNLAFAAGDGVCLAKEAMLPAGYQAVNGGRIRSDRGHVTLLGDLNAVGRAIEAVGRGRVKGIGLGSV